MSTYLQQIQDGIKELTESLNDKLLRGHIVEQKKTWIKHYTREIKRLTGDHGRRVYKTPRRTNKRLEGKQQTSGHSRGRLGKEYNNNGIFAG